LTTSLLPYLSRQQPDIAAFLAEYRKERYLEGRFSYELLLDSANAMKRSIPRSYLDEMEGIAEGAEMKVEEILLLNTFVDTVMAVRGVAAALHASSAPRLESVEFPGADKDGVDNDGDGEIDEAGEGLLKPYAPSAGASLVELPETIRVRFTLTDADGVDPATVRIQLDERIFEPGDPAIEAAPDPADATRLHVVFTPPSPLKVAAVSSVVVRDERLTFTTRGAGKKAHEVVNRGFDDGRTYPPAIAFAARGSATGGDPLLAQHFALLDANTAHKHTAVFIHQPEKGPAFAVVGWAGVIWGFSGLNARGVAYACNYSDSLDNSVVAGLLEQISDVASAKLVASGMPIGMAARRVLEQAASADAAVEHLGQVSHTYGWGCLVADEKGAMK
ncbi:MAG: carcinine hydrolase/isopenicillin-N N-acyltransferase family protein, partial [Myxococcales bacterium]